MYGINWYTVLRIAYLQRKEKQNNFTNLTNNQKERQLATRLSVNLILHEKKGIYIRTEVFDPFGIHC